MGRALPLFLALLLCVPLADAQSHKPGKKRPPRKKAEPAAANAPLPYPGAPEGTLGAACNALAQVPAKKTTDEQRASRAALDFLFATARADAKAAADLLDAAGYQPLPADGRLPETPDKPLGFADLAKRLAAPAPLNVAAAPADRVKIMRRKQLQGDFPAVAGWMLEEDFAALIEPMPVAATASTPGRPDTAEASWPPRRSVIVIRVRGSHAAIVGGTLVR